MDVAVPQLAGSVEQIVDVPMSRVQDFPTDCRCDSVSHVGGVCQGQRIVLKLIRTHLWKRFLVLPLGDIVKVVQTIPHEHMSKPNVEQNVDFPMVRSHEQHVEVVEVIPQERMSECIVEQIVSVVVPQIVKEFVEVVTWVPLITIATTGCSAHCGCAVSSNRGSICQRRTHDGHPVPQLRSKRKHLEMSSEIVVPSFKRIWIT